MVTRRQFLSRVGRAGGIGAACLAMEALGQMAASDHAHVAPRLPAGSGEGVSVVILGAGIAGLTAAYELGKTGYQCRVLEAGDRLGGRNFTLRRGAEVRETGSPVQTCRFDQGLYFNCGPARIPSSHRALLSYCKEFGVELEVFINDNRSALFQDDRAFDGRPVEARQVHHDSAGHIAELLAKALNKRALDAELSSGDRQKLLAFLQQFGPLTPDFSYRGSDRIGLSEPLESAMKRGMPRKPIELRDLLDSRFWWWKMHEEKSLYMQATMLQPVGGMDRIIEAFARRLDASITLNAEVVEIRKRDKGVRIVYREMTSGAERMVEADYCICTVPLTVLADISADFTPEFLSAVKRVRSAPTVKLGWQARKRFWEEERGIYGGISYTEHQIGQLWYPCSGFHSEKGILVGAYMFHGDALAFGDLAPERRADVALKGGARLHQEMPAHVGKAISVAWHRMPFAKGGWAQWTERQRGDEYQILSKPDGRIYLAGEHVSYLNGWQEGAVLSAHSVVLALGRRVADDGK